jgi:hypothetical protein
MKTLALVLAVAGLTGLATPVASFAKIDQNADYYRADYRVHDTGNDPQEAMRQSNCQSRGDCAPVGQ